MNHVVHSAGRRLLSLGVILLISLPATMLVAQTSEAIFFDALAFAGSSPDSGRIDLYLAIPYMSLDFTRGSDGEFTAKYQAHLSVHGKGLKIFDTTFNRSVVTKDYDRTTGNARAYEFFQFRVPVVPGDYETSVEVLDYGTNLMEEADRNVTVVDYDEYYFSLSSPMLVAKIRETETGHAVSPLLTNNVSLLEDWFFLFFEAYNETESDSFIVTGTYRTTGGDVVRSEEFRMQIPRGRSQQWVRLPIEGIARGAYVVEIAAALSTRPGDLLAKSERIVRFGGTVEGMPLSEDELSRRIKQLRYVATQSEFDFIEEGGTFAEKRKRYGEFWQNRDPSPGTARNEAMDEYFRRIDHANENFRSYTEGWLTDMGRIYVIYGPPDRVDRDPFRTDGQPRETWEYYGRRVSLLFMDETGFGDFRLMTPVALSEKYVYGR